MAELSITRGGSTDEDDLHDLSNTTLRPTTPIVDINKTNSSGLKNTEPTTPVDTSAVAINVPAMAQMRKCIDDPSDKLFTYSSNKFRRSSSLRTESSYKNSSRKNVGIVIGDFTRMYPDELTLTIGERIEIISKHIDVSRNIGWWVGRNSKGQTGLFPVSCVKVITSSTSDLETNSDTQGHYPIEIPTEHVKLMEVIGVGGFGKVHRAIYQGEEVAVKVARQTSFDTVKIINDVLSEAEKFARLAHNNVCALVGVSLVRDVYLVMEYAKGGPLSRILHEKNLYLPVDVILDWGRQIADGMKYLHHEALPCMIHRDLKSSNSKCKLIKFFTIYGVSF